MQVRHLLAHRRLAVLICTAALLLKLLVPTGYMIGTDHGRFALTLCSGTASHMTADAPAMHGTMPDHGKSKDGGKAEMPCPFAGLSAAALGPVDPVQLVALIAFVMAVGLAPAVLPAVVRQGHLRPPLRGPPAVL